MPAGRIVSPQKRDMIIRMIKGGRHSVEQIAAQVGYSVSPINRIEKEINVRALRRGQGRRAFMSGKLGTYMRKD